MAKAKFNIKRSSVLGACIAAVVAGQSVNAEELMEEVVVEGFRGTLMQSRDLKRDAVGTRDSIVAEDIADFPDLNLAESLQRVPGVTITRDGGEGRRIALRGLDSNFSLVQLNGMDVLGNTDTAMDSRSQGSRDRAFDFNLFASELFNRIDVNKSYSASQDEGGMAGNVGLRTAKPFDYEGFNAAVSGQLGTNSLAEDTSPRTAFLISNTWGNFGALASVAYSERETIEEGANTFRWRARADDNGDASIYGPGVTAEQEAAMRAGDVRAPRASRLSVWGNEQERLGITTAFQYQADTFDVTLDVLYGELNNDRDEYHLNPRGNEGSMPYGKEVTTNSLTIVDNTLLAGSWSNTNINVESREQQIETEYSQVALSGNWQLTDELKLSGLIGTQTSELSNDSLKVYTETRGDFSFDYTRDVMDPTISYGQDMTDPSQWWLEEIDIRTDLNETDMSTAKVDLEYLVNDSDVVRVGLAFKELENKTARGEVKDILNNADNGAAYAALLDDGFFNSMSDNDRVDWAVVNADAVLNSDFVQNNPNRSKDTFVDLSIGDSTNGVTEETTNFYVEYEWDRQLGEVPFRGNIGVRYYETETESEFAFGDNTETLTSEYDGFLPALNIVFEPAEDMYIRFAWSKNITRPSYGDLSSKVSVSFEGDEIDVRSANPNLEPYESDNLDLGFEWYFGDVGYMAVGFYSKDLEGYIVGTGASGTFDSLGLPRVLLPEGATGSTPTNLNSSVNGEEASLQGVEFTVQRDFDFLPAPYNNFGVIGNYTFADGSVNAYRDGELISEIDFPNLSKNSGNLTVYYETDTWGARISQSYRSSYIQGAGLAGLNDEDFRGFKPTTFVDISAFYQVNDQLKVTFEGSNLTDEEDQQWSSADDTQRLYNVTASGTTFYIGASYQF